MITTSKETVNIDAIKGAQATALIVLTAKALYASEVPASDWLVDFSKTKEIADALPLQEYEAYLGKSRNSKIIAAVGFAVRSKSFEELVDTYLQKYPEAVMVHFGCGLSDRSERLRQKIEAGVKFYDVDFPNMIDLRRKFYTESENYKMIGSDLANYTWIADIPEEDKQKQFIFLAEGVSPYLSEAELKGMFAKLKAEFPGSILIMDTYSELKLKPAKKNLKKVFNADMKYFNDDPAEIVAWDPKGEYKLLEEDNLMLREDFLKNPSLPNHYRRLMHFFVNWCSWWKGLIRSTVTLVFQLGKNG